MRHTPDDPSRAPAPALSEPEMQLVRACARRTLRASDRERIRALLQAGVDWDRVVTLSLRHRLAPLVWSHLRAENVPAATAATLQGLFVRNAGAMLRLSGELLQIVELCRANDVLVVPYKGPALAAQAYGNLAYRLAGDLDLLVRAADVPRARALLLGRGYAPRHALSRGGAEFMRRSRYSEELDCEGGASVELHWAFTNGDIALDLDLDDLAPRLGTIELGGDRVPVFGPADQLLILCVHGCKHRWDRLEWLCGVAELARSHGGEIAWDALVRQAGALGVRRMLLLGVVLAHDLLDAPVPEPVLAAARADRAVVELATEVPPLLAAEMATPDDVPSLATDVFRFRLRERYRDRVRFVWYRATTPSRPESWSAVSIGGRWLPVHGLVRPFRAMRKLLPALRQHRIAARRRA